MTYDYSIQIAAWRMLCISYRYFLTYESLTEKNIADMIAV